MPDRMGLILLVENLDQYEAAIKSVKSANDQVESSMTKVEVRSKKSDKSLLSMASAFAVGNVAALAIVKTFTTVVGGFKQMVVGATMLTARYKVLIAALGATAEQAGLNVKETEDLVQAIHEKGVTYHAATELVLNLVDAEADLEHALDLVTTAQNATARAGGSTSETIQRMLWAMQTNQPYLLRAVYLTTDFAAAEDELAASMDVAVDALSESQLMQARMNAIVKAGIPLQGAYQAAMGQGAKVAGSLKDRIKDIMTLVGEVTYPAWSEMILGAYKRAKQLLAYLDENKEKLEEMGRTLAEGVKLAIVQIDLLIEKVGKIPGAVEAAGVGVAAMVIGFEEAEERSSRLGETAAEAFTLLAAGVAWNVSMFKSLAAAITETAGAMVPFYDTVQLLRGDIGITEWARRQDEALENLGEAWDFGDAVDDAGRAFDDAIISIGEMTGLLEDEEDAIEDVTRSLEDMIAALDDVTEATEDQIKGAEALADLRLDLQHELVNDLIDQERRLIEEEIDLAREREDLARGTAADIADAYAEAAEDRADLAAGLIEEREEFEQDAAREWVDSQRDAARDREDIDRGYADRRIDIEVATRRRLQDIQRQFEMSLQDAARTRDAFALVQAQRRAASERGSALRGREEQLTDAQTAYQRQVRDFKISLAEQREDLRRSLEEQRADLGSDLLERQQAIEQQLQERLAAIQESIRLQEEDRARQMVREQEDAARQAQWEQEDRTRRLQRQLQDMEIQYGDLGNITAEGLMEQAREWADTYGPDGAVTVIVGDWAGFMETEVNRVMAHMEALREATNRLKMEFVGLTGQPWVIDLYLPPELQLRSPKLGLQVGLEKLHEMLERQPLPAFIAGGFPAAPSAGTSRSETYSRSESRHDVNIGVPPNLDLVVQRQLAGTLAQVLKGVS